MYILRGLFTLCGRKCLLRRGEDKDRKIAAKSFSNSFFVISRSDPSGNERWCTNARINNYLFKFLKVSLEIIDIHNNGDAAEEYILLRAIASVNLNDYAVIDRTFDEDGSVSNIHRHFYRFPVQEVKEGEYVSLRTGKGTYKYDKLKNGKPVHRFYWGSETPIWNDGNIESAEVLKVATVARKTTGNQAPAKKPTFTFRPKGLKHGGK